ncbi:MAG: SPASM domain-containing protein [Candidatus Muiribacteriota bacterium]
MTDFILKKHNEPIPVLILDLISYCNLNCIMCPQSKINRNEKFRGVMDFGLYKKIIDELCTPPQKARVIIPFWNGEPALYPEFKKAVEYATEKKKMFPECWEVWSLHSNFTLIDEEVAETIIESDLFGPITVSIDSNSYETYRKIRRGGDFNKTVQNIKNFIKLRFSKKREFPSLILQFIIMDENFEEAGDFIDFWKTEFEKYGIDPPVIWDDSAGLEQDSIFLRRLIAEDNKKQSYYDELHKNVLIKEGLLKKETKGKKSFVSGEYSEEDKKDKNKRRQPCVGLWQHFGIRYDGETSACCRDFRANMSLGNVKETPFFDIWQGEKLKKLRMYHITDNFNLIKICKYCFGQPFGCMTENHLKSYLKSINRYNELKNYLDDIWKK